MEREVEKLSERWSDNVAKEGRRDIPGPLPRVGGREEYADEKHTQRWHRVLDGDLALNTARSIFAGDNPEVEPLRMRDRDAVLILRGFLHGGRKRTVALPAQVQLRAGV